MKQTALQSAIDEIQAMPNYSTGIEYRLRNKIIEILKSKLPEEKQDLIEAHYEGQKECSNEFTMESDAKEYFNQTFEI